MLHTHRLYNQIKLNCALEVDKMCNGINDRSDTAFTAFAAWRIDISQTLTEVCPVEIPPSKRLK